MDTTTPATAGIPTTTTTYSCTFSNTGQTELVCCAASGLCLGFGVAYQDPCCYFGALTLFGCGAGLPNQIKIIRETQNTNIGDRTARVINQQPEPSYQLTDEEKKLITENRLSQSLENMHDSRAEDIRNRYLKARH